MGVGQLYFTGTGTSARECQIYFQNKFDIEIFAGYARYARVALPAKNRMSTHAIIMPTNPGP